MKKLVLAAIAALAIPTLVLAQGTITFGSSGANALNQYFQYSNLDKAAGVTATLWWSPDNVAAYQQVAGSLTSESGTFAGYLFNNATTAVVTGAAGGSTPWFFVRGDLGGMFGTCAAFQSAALGNPNGTPPSPPPALDGWTAPITLVPEPSAIMLAGLGVGALLLFRRRK